MINVFTKHENIEIDGVTITSWLGLKGDKKHGLLEVIEVTGTKEGLYQGIKGIWKTGMFYSHAEYTYKQAMEHWQEKNLPKFSEVTNAA